MWECRKIRMDVNAFGEGWGLIEFQEGVAEALQKRTYII